MVLTGCSLYSGDDNGDVVGPFTGPHHHYVVDGIYLPKTNTEARQMGGDLDGDKVKDNQLGMVISTLGSYGDITSNGIDMIAAGTIRSSVDIVADDLQNDDTASVVYHGAPDDDATAVGGTFAAGSYRSNRTATTHHPGTANAVLPVFTDADPSQIEITNLEIDLQPDVWPQAYNDGGYDLYLHGGIDPKATAHTAFVAIDQMIRANPRDHRTFIALFDGNHDWQISEDEFRTNSLFVSLLSPDVAIDGQPRLSVGIRVHIVPCDGECAVPPLVDRCHDRVIDQDETDVDCGGASCLACPGGGHCDVAADCDSRQCVGGVCAVPTCRDGVRDGFEPDIDCGANCRIACAVGMHCDRTDDCVLGSQCVGGHCWSNSHP